MYFVVEVGFVRQRVGGSERGRMGLGEAQPRFSPPDGFSLLAAARLCQAEGVFALTSVRNCSLSCVISEGIQSNHSLD